ncbi:DUF4923 family protein [Alloprevotella rava]|uniref:DUF4923 domain-containing protein n=1 Tax=Alloprevotella rava TaxID=671218 RepID=A0A7W5UFV4_9BACT|nr:DUF4923 family protein [Alloprevotella rava]MBB3703488.1 hypothetical protein [Alloprevotella rava]
MKRNVFLAAAVVAAGLTLTSCGTTGNASLSNVLGGTTTTAANNQKSESTTSLFGNILSSFLGSKTITEEDLYGTWKYTSTDCVFETENLLKKAGGAVAANKIESEINEQLSKVGIKPGVCTFTFNKDKTFKASVGGRNLSGTYALDSKNKTIKFTTLLGLGSMSANVAKSNGKISLLFDSDRLLKLAALLGSASGNTTLSTLSKLAGSYDGMKLGLQMEK